MLTAGLTAEKLCGVHCDGGYAQFVKGEEDPMVNKNSFSENDLESLLKCARDILERTRSRGMKLSKKFEAPRSEADVPDKSEQLLHDRFEEHWRRLLYTEWMVRFVEAQEHAVRSVLSSGLKKGSASEGGAAEGECVDKRQPLLAENKESCDFCSHSVLLRDSSATNMSQSAATMYDESDSGAESQGRGVASNLGSAVVLNGDKNESVATNKKYAAKLRPCGFRTWYPSRISVMTDVEQPRGSVSSPQRHVLSLCTVVHEKPRGIKAKYSALVSQGGYCKSCLCLLRVPYLPFSIWKKTRFCYYTGLYYCCDCHFGKTRPIPARVLHAWDLEPCPVCNDVIDFLELQRERPLYCVSAVNPALYERVKLLQMVRFLRLQIMALREVGVQCPVFRRLFYRDDSMGQNAPDCGSKTLSSTVFCGAEYEFYMECYVPRSKRYLIEDSEIWSFLDFEEIHRCQKEVVDTEILLPAMAQVVAYSHASVLSINTNSIGGCGECGLMTYLKRLRAQMVRHILQKRCDTCLSNCTDICHWCCRKEMMPVFTETHQGSEKMRSEDISRYNKHNKHMSILYSFDLLHVRTCHNCGASYHKECFDKMRCSLEGSFYCLCCTFSDERNDSKTQ